MSGKLENTFIKCNGIRLHVVQAGPEDGPRVVLLHGFPEFWYGWRQQIEPLAAAGYRVVVPDQRGYNLSAKPRGVENYQVHKLAGDVVGLLDALGEQQALLAGHDWGAAVAWETAIRHPERVRKLAILNVPHPDVMQRFLRSNFEQLRKSWYMFFFQLPVIPEAMLRANDWDAAVKMLLRSARPGSFSAADIEQYRQAWWRKDAMTSMLNWYRAAFRSAARQPGSPDELPPRRVTVPTLILWGKNDVALSHHMAQPSCDLCDNGLLVFFENATHWVQHDEAEGVNKALLSFFA